MLAFSNSNMPYLIVFPLKAGADAFNAKPETIEISLGHHVLLWHEWFDAAATYHDVGFPCSPGSSCRSSFPSSLKI
jgi:hypothetical protein